MLRDNVLEDPEWMRHVSSRTLPEAGMDRDLLAEKMRNMPVDFGRSVCLVIL